jgi:hypothetical protein
MRPRLASTRTARKDGGSSASAHSAAPTVVVHPAAASPSRSGAGRRWPTRAFSTGGRSSRWPRSPAPAADLQGARLTASEPTSRLFLLASAAPPLSTASPSGRGRAL